MTTAHAPHLDAPITPDDLLGMRLDRVCELVDGQLLEKPMGARSGMIGGELYRQIANYLVTHPIACVTQPEIGFQCFPDKPTQVRKPDVAVISRQRLSKVPEGWIRQVPEFVCEVISQRDEFRHIEGRIGDFLNAGTDVGWVVDPHPDRPCIHVYSPGGHRQTHVGDVSLPIDVLPGLTCSLKSLADAV